jgi:hypothetical protein
MELKIAEPYTNCSSSVEAKQINASEETYTEQLDTAQQTNLRKMVQFKEKVA